LLLDSVIYLQNPSRHEKLLHKALGQTVGEVMTDKPISITADRPLKEAASLMYDRHVRRLPVIEEETHKVIGIITRGDIIRDMAKSEA
jgi:CBS domain-containing protein